MTTMKNFRAEDMSRGKSPATILEEEGGAVAVEQPSPVPNGNASDVLAWVDGDPDRATEALEHEKSSSNPRKGLSSELEEIAAK